MVPGTTRDRAWAIRAVAVADEVPEGGPDPHLVGEVEEAERVWMRVRVESPVGVVRNAPPRECACIPPYAERRELTLLHLNALAAVRLRALYLEVVVLAAMRLDREI